MKKITMNGMDSTSQLQYDYSALDLKHQLKNMRQ